MYFIKELILIKQGAVFTKLAAKLLTVTSDRLGRYLLATMGKPGVAQEHKSITVADGKFILSKANKAQCKAYVRWAIKKY